MAANANRADQWNAEAGKLFWSVGQEIAKANAGFLTDLQYVTNTISVASYVFAWVPGVFLLGRVADLVNAGIYTMEGNYLQGGLTAVTSLVPLAGKALSLGAAAGEAGGLAAIRFT